jgi:eukaryotic-like serine/threonine-protein kinase
MSSPEIRRRALALFDEYAELSMSDRDAAMRALAREDAALAAQLSKLLAADAQAEALETPLRAAVFSEEPPPANIGPYRLIRELGRGGMGTVWLAERDGGQFLQQVALKLIRGGADSSALLRRFLRERQILARLIHPNIARLLDGGADVRGQPFFAMEYVDGQPLLRYCDDNRLALAQRLDLFAQVLDAVGYAHRQLVVHRDLKPSNVLVDADGHARLLDFGIAKLLDASDADDTRSGVRPMTPAYAAPEQLKGEPITTATDAYSLGLLLYELLCGVRPTAETRAFAPSDALRQDADAEALAATRATTAAKLSASLHGDLDAIVRHAIVQEPAGRYPTVDAFAEDLRRFRTGLPVRARGALAGYRMAKFLRRHRSAMAFAAIALLAILVGAAASLWQAQVASRQAREARAVTDFLVDIFRASDPASTAGREVSVRELLDQGARRIDSELSDTPDLHARLAGILASINTSLARYDDADALLSSALDVPDLDTATQTSLLLDRASNGIEQGKPATADASLAQAQPLAQSLLTTQPQLEARRLALLGDEQRHAANFTAAAQSLQQALQIDEAHGLQALAVAHTNTLSAVYGDAHRDADAEHAARDAVALARALYSKPHPELESPVINLGSILSREGKFGEAQPLLNEGLALSKKLFGDNHPETARAEINLAMTQARTGDFASAETLLNAALSAQRASLGEQHTDVAATLNNLGSIQTSRGELAAAEQNTRAAKDVWLALKQTSHPRALDTDSNLAIVLIERNKLGEAQALLQQSLEQRRTILGAEHLTVPATMNRLGVVARAQGQYEQAERWHRDALAIIAKTQSADAPEVLYTQHLLQQVACLRSDGASTLPDYRTLMTKMRDKLPPAHPRRAESELDFAECNLLRGDIAQARTTAKDEFERRAASLGEHNFRSADVRAVLGEAEAKDKDSELARKDLSIAIVDLQASRGADHPRTQAAMQALAALPSAQTH